MQCAVGSNGAADAACGAEAGGHSKSANQHGQHLRSRRRRRRHPSYPSSQSRLVLSSHVPSHTAAKRSITAAKRKHRRTYV